MDLGTIFHTIPVVDSFTLLQRKRQQKETTPWIQSGKHIQPSGADITKLQDKTDLLMQQAHSSRNTADNTFLRHAGPLRILWAAIVVICLVMVFFSDSDDTGWRVIPVHIAPVLVILNLWGLLFDLLMSSLFMMHKQGQERLRYRHILMWDGSLLVALVAFWGPTFVSLFTGS